MKPNKLEQIVMLFTSEDTRTATMILCIVVLVLGITVGASA